MYYYASKILLKGVQFLSFQIFFVSKSKNWFQFLQVFEKNMACFGPAFVCKYRAEAKLRD
jgi:hypothetical protein